MKELKKRIFIIISAFAIAFAGLMVTSAPTYAGTDKVYLGKFTVTAYCGCKKCNGKYAGKTSTGVKPKAGRTIAVDPKKIKLKSKVMINGKTYRAEDTGSAIKGKRIDIYFSSHAKANRFGRKKIKVYKVVKSAYDVEVTTTTEDITLNEVSIAKEDIASENQ